MSEATRDTIFNGRLTLWQPARQGGYRFNLDPILLASFARSAASVVDLGAGCGVLGLALVGLGKAQSLTFVELQSSLADLVERNIQSNALADKARLIRGDLRAMALDSVEHVVFNPPYFKANSGRGAPNDSRDAARHERNGTLQDFVIRAAKTATGFVSAIVPWNRSKELVEAWKDTGGSLRRLRHVRPRHADNPKLALFEGTREPVSFIEEPALVIHADGTRDFTPEVEAMVAGRLL
ncbi:MAG: methyltransferase [Clostridia bacterium]|nr:methyltransferase [Deltaproteobacteria bacterium]